MYEVRRNFGALDGALYTEVVCVVDPKIMLFCRWTTVPLPN